jgi:hypothetical protein
MICQTRENLYRGKTNGKASDIESRYGAKKTLAE